MTDLGVIFYHHIFHFYSRRRGTKRLFAFSPELASFSRPPFPQIVILLVISLINAEALDARSPRRRLNETLKVSTKTCATVKRFDLL